MNKMNWIAIKMRTTVFWPPDFNLAEMVDYKSLVGEEPEKSTNLPKRGTKIEEGLFLNNTLILKNEPMRADLVLQALSNPQDLEEGVPGLGLYKEIKDPYVEVVKKWVGSLKKISRLAFAPSLILPVSNREEGYKKLEELLPSIKIDSKNSSDFLYQINRPRESSLKIESLKINRLSKWSVTILKTGLFSIDSIEKPKISKEFFQCSLELDINTSPDYQNELPEKKITSILGELILFGDEIIEKGDIQ